MKKYIVLGACLLSVSALAAELKMKERVAYNGGTERGSICQITLMESHGKEARVQVRTPLRSGFKGPAREFKLFTTGPTRLAGKGSTQQYISPRRTVSNPDEILLFNLNADGTPQSYVLKSRSANRQLLCSGLLDAPY